MHFVAHSFPRTNFLCRCCGATGLSGTEKGSEVLVRAASLLKKRHAQIHYDSGRFNRTGQRGT